MSIELQESPTLAPRIAALLRGLRLRIRGYVWAEGAAMVVLVLGLAFWSSLAFDWLFEPPWQFRAVMMAATGAVILYVLNRFILRRAFRTLDDAELAIVLERRFRDYHDSLLTTVELGRRSGPSGRFNAEMFDHTRREAARQSEAVRLGTVFRTGPLLRLATIAAFLAMSVVAFAIAAPEAFAVWTDRVVLLNKNLLWPRTNHVRVADFPADRIRKVAKGSDFEITAVADLTGRFKLPDSVQLRYRTDEGTQGRDNMSSVGAPGAHGQDQKYSYVFKGVMSSIAFDIFGGDDRDRDYRIEVVDNPTISHMQLACVYPEYTGRPANTVPASALVQLPQGTKVTIECEANKDLLNVPITIVQGDKATALTDVELPPDGDRRHFSVSLPPLMEDTTLLFELNDADGIRSRDPVRLVLAARPDDVPTVAMHLRGISTAITQQAQLPVVGDAHDDYGLSRLWFEYQIDKPKLPDKNAIAGPALDASALDTAKGDAPAVGTQLFHVSTLGSDGRPLGQIKIESTDNEMLDLKHLAQVADLLRKRGVKTPDDLSRLSSPDQRALVAGITTQQQIAAAMAFPPQVGSRLDVALKATDNCALSSGENVGQGERYQLDIVPPEQLLSMLEGRELMLRRQFEIIYQEFSDTRDGLARLNFGCDVKPSAEDQAGREPGDKLGTEPGDAAARKSGEPSGSADADAEKSEKSDDASGAAAAADETPQQKADRLAKHTMELRDLRVARALDNADRATHETQVVADAFDDIREEMINNRVDTPELQTRLKDQIGDPLRRISGQMFPELRTRLVALRRTLDDPTAGAAQLKIALSQCDAILTEMKLVLDKMLELETFNEVVDKLRDIITDQQKLNHETQERQKQELKNKLRDLQN